PRPNGTCASGPTGIGTVPFQARTAAVTTTSRRPPPVLRQSWPLSFAAVPGTSPQRLFRSFSYNASFARVATAPSRAGTPPARSRRRAGRGEVLFDKTRPAFDFRGRSEPHETNVGPAGVGH